MMPIATQLDRSSNRALRVTVAVIVLQFWAVAAYVVTGPVPYFWREAAYPSLVASGVPAWLLGIAALLLAMPGFWVVAFGGVSGAVFAAAGASVWALYGRLVTTWTAVWLAVGTLLNVALLIFSLTAAGRDIRIWVLD